MFFCVSTVHKAGQVIGRCRRYPRKTLKNRSHVDRIWGQQGNVDIWIPKLIDQFLFRIFLEFVQNFQLFDDQRYIFSFSSKSEKLSDIYKKTIFFEISLHNFSVQSIIRMVVGISVP